MFARVIGLLLSAKNQKSWEKGRYSCTSCRKHYSSAQAYEAHMKNHESTNTFPCPNCEKSFSRKSINVLFCEIIAPVRRSSIE